jgi:hypothetical protein
MKSSFSTLLCFLVISTIHVYPQMEKRFPYDFLLPPSMMQEKQTEKSKNSNVLISEVNSDVSNAPIISSKITKALNTDGCLIYHSTNLAGHSVFAECFYCFCDPTDAAIESYPDYGVVRANPNKRKVFVNAIGYKKFTDNLLPGLPVQAGEYKYSAYIRLPVLPKPDVNQEANPEAAHLMIQAYDGNNQVWKVGKKSVEATIYWDLNAWQLPEYGKIKVYTEGKTLFYTGILLQPDVNWHFMELRADFNTMKYISITIDNQTVDLSAITLAKVDRPDYGSDLSLSITTESENASNSCDRVFYWDTYYRDINLSFNPTILSTTDNSHCGSGTVLLGATASSGTINWYTTPTGGTSVGTGTSFTTPVISETTIYYVDATYSGCTTSTRTPVTATISICPGINEVSTQEGIDIFPNPSDGFISIKCANKKVSHFEIINSSGQTIHKIPITKDLEQFEFKTDGIYFLRFYEGRNVITKKVVIKK